MLKKTAIMIMILLLVVTLSSCAGNARDYYINWLHKNGARFEEYVEQNAHVESGALNHMAETEFGSTGVSRVNCEERNGDVYIYFSTSYDLPEGSTCLVYAKKDIDTFANDILLLKNGSVWTVETNTDKKKTWTGGGADGSGYITVEELSDHWFYLEISYPT